MGAAAEHRANAVAREILGRDHSAAMQRDMAQRGLQVAEDCNEFTRQALAYLVEPRGMRQPTVERAKTRRGYAKRHTALVNAHCAWVGVDSRDLFAYSEASVKRSRAAYALLCFALGTWTIPDAIQVPCAAAS
ncbi:MAG: hypothetical protein ACYC4S_10910 [Rhodoferax sp.]